MILTLVLYAYLYLALWHTFDINLPNSDGMLCDEKPKEPIKVACPFASSLAARR
jgi:hypothetical protein